MSARVTLIVVPRERFSYALPALDRLYDGVGPGHPPFELIYVTGGAPAAVVAGLARRARRHGFRLLESDCPLSPTEARNAGLAEADTDYVVFMDNDIAVHPGWLAALLRCADETGADVVCPVICWGPLRGGEPDFERVHFAGGMLNIREENGLRRAREEDRYWGRPWSEVSAIPRTQCTLAEFHCMLARRALFERTGPLDESIYSTREHVDFSLSVAQAGGAIWVEPAARASYVLPTAYTAADVAYHLLRWSTGWNHASLARLNRKWNLNDDYADFERDWLTPHRRHALHRLRHACRAVAGIAGAAGRRAADRLLDRLETVIAARGSRLRRRAGRAAP